MSEMPRPAPGMRHVFNRRDHPVEYIFDGQRYGFAALETVTFPADIAEHFWRHSLVSLDPKNRQVIRELALDGDAEFGKPLRAGRGVELLDRSQTDSFVEAGTGGIPTRAQAVPVAGAVVDTSRNEYPELGTRS